MAPCIAAYGATWGTIAEGNAKSSCRLYCMQGTELSVAGWCTDYVRTTMKVLDPEQTALALGAPFGGEAALPSEMEATLRKQITKELRYLMWIMLPHSLC